MSPFSTYFQNLRRNHGISQRTLAELMGYEQSFISIMELGRKGPPNETFINKLIMVLDLDSEEQIQLRRTIKYSTKKFVLPSTASVELYNLVHELWGELDNLEPIQINLMRQIVGMKRQLNFSSKEQKYGKIKKADQVRE